MATSLRILVVTSQLPPDIGGTSVYAAEIAQGLARLGHRVTLLVRDRDPAEFAALGLDVVSVDTRRGWLKPLRQRRAQREILELVRERRIDVVHFAYTVVGFGDLYGRLARNGVPYVVAIHGFKRSDVASPAAIAKRRRKWGLAGAARVVCCSRWLAEQMQPLVRKPVDAVHLGISPVIEASATPERVAELRRRFGLEGRRVLLCLGRFVPRKNFDAVIQQLPALCQRFDDLVLLMVGGGSEEARWKALAEELGVADRVIWGPQVAPHEVGAYYKAADLLVSVSRTRPEDDTSETFGLVYCEAHLCGTACVGGKEGGVPEAVLDGETGLLVSSEDPDGLYRALERLLADPAERQRMAEAGRKRVLEHFRWDRCAGETAAILRDAAGIPA